MRQSRIRRVSTPISAEGSIVAKNVVIKASEEVYAQVQNRSTKGKKK
ncbi:MAG: hypothetical protein M3218_00970 [Thermoproteota archaeon]|nr:hypothetical protein [Thermoproteota archaeon]